MECSRTASALLFLALALSSVTAAQSPVFKFKDITIPGALQTWVAGVNDSGVMVGWYVDQLGNSHGFSLAGGKVTGLNNPKGTNTQLYAINLAGDVVGTYVNGCAGEVCSQAFLYRGGTFTDIGPSNVATTAAYGINDLGHFAGSYGDGFGGQQAFFWNGSTYAALNGLSAIGINDTGLITVQRVDSASNVQSYIYDGSTYVRLRPPSAKATYAEAINNENDVVMYWGDLQAGYLRGALLHEGAYYKFADPAGVDCTLALGINDNRVVVGAYAPGGLYDIHVHGFVATY